MQQDVGGTRRDFLRLTLGGALIPDRGTQLPPATIERKLPLPLAAPGAGEVVIACGGDWFLTRPLPNAPGNPVDAVFDIFRSANAGFVNLENGLSTVGTGDLGGFRYGDALRANPSLASELRKAGVRAVSLANNHTGNFGPDALLETVQALDGAGISHAGAGRNSDTAFGAALIKAEDTTIAFCSFYTLYHQFGALDHAAPDRPGVAVCRAYDVVVEPPIGFDIGAGGVAPFVLGLDQPCSQTIVAAARCDLDRLKEAVGQAAKRADFTLVSVHVHWGRHTRHDLPPNLRPFAHELVDAGADLIVGHGPHAIRGIEVYRGKPILHSVGNLVLMPPSGTPDDEAPSHEGIVVRATVAARRVKRLEFVPIAIGPDGFPGIAENSRAERILGTLSGLTAHHGVQLARRDGYRELVLT